MLAETRNPTEFFLGSVWYITCIQGLSAVESSVSFRYAMRPVPAYASPVHQNYEGVQIPMYRG